MQFTKPYILRCCKADDVQECWDPVLGDFFVDDGYDVFAVTRTSQDLSNSFWIPRQDQLQDIITDMSPKHRDASPLRLISDFYMWISGKKIENLDRDKLPSMERLWLGYVMDLIFNKKWSGKEKRWVNR